MKERPSANPQEKDHPLLRATGIAGTIFAVFTVDPALGAASGLLWYVNRKHRP